MAELAIDHLQQREGHWAIVDLNGKGVTSGRGLSRALHVDRGCGNPQWKGFPWREQPWQAWGDGVTEKLAWHVVKEFATRTGLNLAPHDLRRCAACGIIAAPAHGFATLLATN